MSAVAKAEKAGRVAAPAVLSAAALAKVETSREGSVPNAPWPVVPLGEIAEVKLGKMLDKAKHTSGRLLPYLRNVNVRWGTVNTDDLREMHFDEDEMDRFGLKTGDVLVCEGGEPGRSAVWNGSLPQLKFQKAIHRVRFRKPFEPSMLVYLLEEVEKFFDLLREGRNNGTLIVPTGTNGDIKRDSHEN